VKFYIMVFWVVTPCNVHLEAVPYMSSSQH